MKHAILLAGLLSLSFGANAGLVTVLGYTFDDNSANVFSGITVDYDTDPGEPNGIEGALDFIGTSVNPSAYFDTDTNNPYDVDASVTGFIEESTQFLNIAPSVITFDVFQGEFDNPLGTLLEFSAVSVGGGELALTVTGGAAAAYFTGGTLLFDDTIVGAGFGEFTNPDFTLTMTATPVSAVPVPAAVWLFGSGLLGMVGIARRRKS